MDAQRTGPEPIQIGSLPIGAGVSRRMPSGRTQRSAPPPRCLWTQADGVLGWPPNGDGGCTDPNLFSANWHGGLPTNAQRSGHRGPPSPPCWFCSARTARGSDGWPPHPKLAPGPTGQQFVFVSHTVPRTVGPSGLMECGWEATMFGEYVPVPFYVFYTRGGARGLPLPAQPQRLGNPSLPSVR